MLNCIPLQIIKSSKKWTVTKVIKTIAFYAIVYVRRAQIFP